jgi:uncharacterized caspase-like protein
MRIKSIFPLLLGFSLLASIFLSFSARAQEPQRGLGVGQASPGGTGRYYALVIGNNAYTSLQHLKTAEADALAVAALLKVSYGFDTTLLLNATRQQIMAALYAYRRSLAPDANLFIYYAGHGVNDKDADKAYWLPVDATLDDNSNWIIADEITTALKVIPAKHVLVVSDSCYWGTLTRGLGELLPRPTEREQFLKKMQAGKSRTLMASGGDEPVADGGGGGKHSVFANALLRGLREMDKGQFTAGELFRYHVEEAVAGRANQTPEYNPLRNSGHESGDFVFVKIIAVVKNTEKIVKVPTAPTLDLAASELSYWETIKNSTDPADYRAYLVKYPNGRFVEPARNRLASMEKSRDISSMRPKLAFAGTEDIKSQGAYWTRYKLSVVNRSDYIDQMFEVAPDLPPCGNNTKASRSWVDIYDRGGNRLNGFCNITSSDGLDNLWFALPKGEKPPDLVYIIIDDRRLKKKFKSNTVSASMP